MEETKHIPINRECVKGIIEGYGARADSLISILQDIQSKYNYLPEDALRQVANNLGLSMIQVYGVATFFKAFSLKPRGKHIANVCLGTACHVRGAPGVLEEMERQLGIGSGDTTKDLQFTLETVNCVGACALGPIVIVDGKYNGQMNTAKVKRMLSQSNEPPRQEEDEQAEVAI